MDEFHVPQGDSAGSYFNRDAIACVRWRDRKPGSGDHSGLNVEVFSVAGDKFTLTSVEARDFLEAYRKVIK
jgi:hypothetical protein